MKKINLKLGDSCFFHYTILMNLESFHPDFRPHVTFERRLRDTFGLLEPNGSVWFYLKDSDCWYVSTTGSHGPQWVSEMMNRDPNKDKNCLFTWYDKPQLYYLVRGNK